MNITHNGQTIAFIVDNGDLMQITPCADETGDKYRKMATYVIDGISVSAQDRDLARKAAGQWNAMIDNYSHADDEYAMLKPTDAEPETETDTDIAPMYPAGTPEYAAYAAELRAELAKFESGEPPYEIGAMAADQYIAAGRDRFKIGARSFRWRKPGEPVGYVVKFSASAGSDVVSVDYVRYADAAAYFWNLVASHTTDGSSVPVSTHPLALRREGVDNIRGTDQRWMVSLDVASE